MSQMGTTFITDVSPRQNNQNADNFSSLFQQHHVKNSPAKKNEPSLQSVPQRPQASSYSPEQARATFMQVLLRKDKIQDEFTKRVSTSMSKLFAQEKRALKNQKELKRELQERVERRHLH